MDDIMNWSQIDVHRLSLQAQTDMKTIIKNDMKTIIKNALDTYGPVPMDHDDDFERYLVTSEVLSSVLCEIL